ncbi:MAG TPA: GlsB/YeaQ/YmgE family stress response membrane protein [Albitalea sp.]|nr:GlsB/YeaQ/YmgE family stress response membrane protein [Albitalea sp.]
MWLVVGGLVGWLASLVIGAGSSQRLVSNLLVGMAGAILGGWLIAPLVGIPATHQDVFSIGAFIVSLLGAAGLLCIVNVIHRTLPR